MAKLKKLGLEDLGGLVYSTNPHTHSAADEETEEITLSPKEQFLEAHFSNKGRGGKIVTLIKGFQGNENDLKILAKALKNHCGAGGSVKEGEILIQGNFRDKIMAYLTQQGYRVKRVGG